MAYNLLVSPAQLERIHEALKRMDREEPLTAEQLKDYNLECLTDCIEATLAVFPDDNMVHGICL